MWYLALVFLHAFFLFCVGGGRVGWMALDTDWQDCCAQSSTKWHLRSYPLFFQFVQVVHLLLQRGILHRNLFFLRQNIPRRLFQKPIYANVGMKFFFCDLAYCRIWLKPYIAHEKMLKQNSRDKDIFRSISWEWMLIYFILHEPSFSFAMSFCSYMMESSSPSEDILRSYVNFSMFQTCGHKTTLQTNK